MKKKLIRGISLDREKVRKIWMTMRLIVLLFFVSLIHVSASVYSQKTKLNIRVENATLQQVFKVLQEQSEFDFFYKNEQIPADTRVSIETKNEAIEVILDKILTGTGLTYHVLDKDIVISTKGAAKSEMITQQQKSVSGKVTDSSGASLPGVSIVVKGTTNGTITDGNGNYSLSNVPENAFVQFSFVGMKGQEVAVGEKTTINVTLAEEAIGIEEVVAIGYGTQRRADVTSSVATVKSENFLKGNVKDAGQLIQGKVAGLTIVSPSGDPTSSSQIVLRGNTTLLGASISPLVLVDGIPGDLKTVAPQDIESIDVLKDGSAAAIYGTRGTNGVILITTRRASGSFKSSVEYSSFASVQSIARKLNLSTAADFRQQIADGFRAANTDLGTETDWLNEITRQPVNHVHNLTFRGGNPTTNYLVNVNYNSAEGVFLKSYNEAFIGRADINHSMFDNKVKINLNILNSTKKLNGFNGYIYRQAMLQNPTAPLKNQDGTWFQELSKFEYENPVSDLMESDGRTDEHLSRFNNTISYTPVKGLKLSSVLSISKWNQNGGYSETKQHVSTLRDSRNGYARIGASESADKLAELTAEYSKSIGNHSFKALTGYSYQENVYTTMSMENWDFPTDQFGYYNIGLGEANKNGKVTNPQSSYHAETNLIGFFGRLTYNYNDKYLLMASLRREEASQLVGTKDPWGLFPAVSAGWRLTNESFMKNQRLFNDIKLRAGYGVTGTQPTDLFRGVGMIGYSEYVLSNGKWVRTLIPTQNSNSDLRWEEKRETDFGVDFSMLNNRISGSIDYYVRKIDGLLFDFAVPSPPNLYSTTRANVGKMKNKGLEILINVVPVKTDDFEWTTGFTFSTNSNKLVSLTNDVYKTSSDYFTTGYTGPPVQTFTHIVKVGEPIGNFYGFKVIGIGEDATDVANYGQWIYEGADGEAVKYKDFTHSFGDKKVIGNGLPKYYAGWVNNFRYKNLDLSISQRGAFKFQVANFQRMMYENPTYTQYNLLKTAFDPLFGKTQLKSPQEFNSYYVEDGDYWKIDNITLGYNIPKTGIKYIQSARFYVSSLNTFILTGYKGIDPEVSLVTSGGGSQGGININSGAGLAP
ncbi:MAG: SusC/RagA family TonB-linked outer membrane protein [Bacteroidota bacterium]|nr:SusC/RagA family TonB-linked outer membrane protein [Bacteroidota bacterium]